MPQQPFDLGGAIQGVLAANPSLGQTPELALGAAQSPDPYGTSEVMSHASNLDAMQQTHDAHAQRSSAGSSGFFGTLGHLAHVAVRDTESAIGSGLTAAKNAGSFALTQLSRPLGDVQHDYRYIRAVYDRHGPVAGTLELLGIGVGAAGGALLGDLPGAVVGADAAASAEQRLFYHKTAADTAKAYTDRNGNDVSFGRDLAHLANYVTGGHVQNDPGHFDAFDVISGLGDATFDIAGDPLLGAGRVKKAADLAGNARLGALVGGDATKLGRRISTGRLISSKDSAEDVLRVYENRPEVRRTFDTLAKMSAGDISTRLPKLAPLAPELGAAKNENEVAAVFHQAAVVGEYGFSSSGLPKTGITRGVLSRLNAGIYDRLTVPVKDAEGNVRMTGEGDAAEPLMGLNRLGRVYNMFQAYRPFAYDPELDKLSTDSFTSTNPMAYNAIARVMRYSQSPQTVAKVMDKYFAEGSDAATHAAVYKNAVIDMLRAGGMADTHPILQQMRGAMDEIGVGGENDLYALDKMGLDLSRYERADGSEIKAGMFVNQQGRMTFPNFQAIKNVLRDEKGGAIGALGRADQFIASNYLGKVFKPLALLSLGFAQRVSLAELLPGSLTLGARKVAGLQLLNAGRKLAPEEYARQVEAHTAKIGAEAARDEAEAIPAAATAPIHQGEIDSAVAANPGVDLLPGEHEHVAAAVAKTLFDSVWGKPVLMAGKGYAGKGLMRMSSALLDDDYRRVLMNLTVRRGAHVVSPALMTGDHGLMSDADAGQKIPMSINHVGASVPGRMQVGDGFKMWKTSDEQHPAMWSAALREPAGDKGARLMAKTILLHDDENAGKFAAIAAHDKWLGDIAGRTDVEAQRYKGLIRVKEFDPATSTYSEDKYNAIMGLVTGGDGTVHKDLLENIAKGHRTDLKTLQKIDLDARPVKVKGPSLNPVTEPDAFDKLVAKGFKPLEAIINHLSREPLYVASVTKEYKFLKPLVDAGVMSEDEAMLKAEQRAIPNMLPLIHNVDLRNQFSDTFRNVMPFYFAQEQAARRYGSVVLSDPAAAAKLLLVHHLIADTGIVRTNPDDPSQRYVVIPGGGPVATWLAGAIGATGLVGTQSGIPTQFAGNLQSLKTVVPEGQLPSLSPVISVPLKMIEQRFPESSDVIAPVIGPIAESSTSVWSQILPSGSIRNLLTAAQGSSQSASFTTAYIYAAANAMRQGKLREDMTPPEKDMELARIRNTARIYFVAKGLLAAISPLSPKMDVGDLPLRQELTRLIKEKGGFAEGMDAFLKAHPDATPSAVFASESKVGGALPPSTGATTRFLTEHGKLVANYAYAAPFLIPQDAKGNYDATAQNMELSLGLRQRKDIGRFVETVFIAQGASEYFDKEHQYQAALKQLQDAGQTDLASALTAGWQSWAAAFKVAHPTFATDLGSQTGKRTVDGVQAVKEMGEIFAKGLAPENSQTALVKTLYDQYQQYAAAYKQAKAGGDRTMTAALYNGWQAHLDQFAIDNPAAKQVVRTVFARLPRPVPDLEAAQ